MSYIFYMAGEMLPVTPGQLQIKTKNQNRTIALINESEVNLLKSPGLTDISFRVLLPNVHYPFARYTGGFRGAAHYLELIEHLKTQTDKNGKILPFQFIVSRTMPNGAILFDSNIKVSLEDYKMVESADNGFDVFVDISLKQYRNYGTKTVNLNPATAVQPNATVQVEESRPAESAPQEAAITVVEGDSLWSVSKRYLRDGERFRDIYALNQRNIDERNRGSGRSKYTVHPGQVVMLPL